MCFFKYPWRNLSILMELFVALVGFCEGERLKHVQNVLFTGVCVVFVGKRNGATSALWGPETR